MLPAVALVGRTNVGKSTLFNQLTGSRDALVADFPGLTRDRRYGFGKRDGRAFLVVDTGGLGDDVSDTAALAALQTEIAVDEADAIVFVVDYKDGLTAADERVAEQLRSSNKPVTVAVNKSEGMGPELAEAEFHSLGLGAPVSIAALHGRRLAELMTNVLAHSSKLFCCPTVLNQIHCEHPPTFAPSKGSVKRIMIEDCKVSRIRFKRNISGNI